MLVRHPGVDFEGDGVFLILCRFCWEQAEYNVAEMIGMIVEEERTTPPRLKPSGIYRRPLSDDYPGARPTFGGNYVELRPESATIIARCVSLWPEVEAACAGLLALFLGHESRAAMSVFLAIRSSRTQFEAMVAAAQIALHERDLRLFNALMHLKDKTERQRNYLAHGHFGIAPRVKRGLVWVSVEDRAHSHVQVGPESLAKLISKTYVYEPEDLETIAQEIEELSENLNQFSAYLSRPTGAQRDERFQQLCALPRVAEALDHLDGQKRTREERQRRPRKGRH